MSPVSRTPPVSPTAKRAYRLLLNVLLAMLVISTLWTIPDLTQLLLRELHHMRPTHAKHAQRFEFWLLVSSALCIVLFTLLYAWVLYKMHQVRRWAVLAWTVLQVLSALSLPEYYTRMAGTQDGSWGVGTVVATLTASVNLLASACLWLPALRRHWWRGEAPAAAAPASASP